MLLLLDFYNACTSRLMWAPESRERAARAHARNGQRHVRVIIRGVVKTRNEFQSVTGSQGTERSYSVEHCHAKAKLNPPPSASPPLPPTAWPIASLGSVDGGALVSLCHHVGGGALAGGAASAGAAAAASSASRSSSGQQRRTTSRKWPRSSARLGRGWG